MVEQTTGDAAMAQVAALWAGMLHELPAARPAPRRQPCWPCVIWARELGWVEVPHDALHRLTSLLRPFIEAEADEVRRHAPSPPSWRLQDRRSVIAWAAAHERVRRRVERARPKFEAVIRADVLPRFEAEIQSLTRDLRHI